MPFGLGAVSSGLGILLLARAYDYDEWCEHTNSFCPNAWSDLFSFGLILLIAGIPLMISKWSDIQEILADPENIANYQIS